jgi:hypothetical protein
MFSTIISFRSADTTIGTGRSSSTQVRQLPAIHCSVAIVVSQDSLDVAIVLVAIQSSGARCDGGCAGYDRLQGQVHGERRRCDGLHRYDDGRQAQGERVAGEGAQLHRGDQEGRRQRGHGHDGGYGSSRHHIHVVRHEGEGVHDDPDEGLEETR